MEDEDLSFGKSESPTFIEFIMHHYCSYLYEGKDVGMWLYYFTHTHDHIRIPG
jgi:hypothetical protein